MNGNGGFRLILAFMLTASAIAMWNIWFSRPLSIRDDHDSIRVPAVVAKASNIKKQQPIEDEQMSSESEADVMCHPWSHNSDEWWTHHPEFEIYNETKNWYCFRKITAVSYTHLTLPTTPYV